MRKCFPCRVLVVLPLLLLLLGLSLSPVLAGTIGFDGHNPPFNIGYTDGNHARPYTVPPNMRQGASSLNAARSSIWANEMADTYVNFTFDTTGKTVYLVYTTDGSRPTKSNGTSVAASFSKYDDPDRTWYATIPGQPAGTTVEYVFYISNDTLAAGWGRVTQGGGYQTTWVEGDQAGYQYSVTPVHNVTQGTDYATIQAAVTAANAGDLIQIDPGTYNENVTVTKSLTLDGAGPTTIIEGSTLGLASGITVNTGVQNVTIKELRLQNHSVGANAAGITFTNGNNGLTVQNVEIDSTTGGRGGLYINGPVDNVLIDHVTATNNAGRAIVIWNGYKSHITITNNTVTGNACCGIELQDGTASGVTIADNTVSVTNGDSAIAAIGLKAGAGANLIANNTVNTSGRYGIEIKMPVGTGATSGDGSIVLSGNTVNFVAPLNRSPDDIAGIAVMRRGFAAAGHGVDVPTGVVVTGNTVTGFQKPIGEDGFGIVVEGTNMTVTGNTLTNNHVGVQLQAGNPSGYPGDSADTVDDYFWRGNSPIGCAAIGGNTFSGNTVDERRVGAVGGGTVTNTRNGETFCSIQAAHDDADTANGDALQASAGTYEEQVEITKQITLEGAGIGQTIILSPTTLTKSFTVGTATYKPIVWVHDQDGVAIQDLTVDGAGRGNNNVRFAGIAYINAGGTIHLVNVKDVRNTPVTSVQESVGIYGRVTNGTARTLNVTNSTVSGFQKNGLTFIGTGLTAMVTGNTVTGLGPINSIGQNGIQLSDGAGGTISGNTVSNIAYTPNTYIANCVLVDFAAAGATVANNMLYECHGGVYMAHTSGTISGNIITNTPAGMGVTPDWWGIVVWADSAAFNQSPLAQKVPPAALLDDGNLEAPVAPAAMGVTVSTNQLNLGGKGVGIGAYLIAGQDIALTATTNTVSNTTVGAELYEAAMTLTSTFANNTFTNTGRVGTGIALYAGAEALIGSAAMVDTARNHISGFATGISIAGTATVQGNSSSIQDNTTGIHVVSGGNSTIVANDILDSDVGLLYDAGATSSRLYCNNIQSPSNVGLENNTGATFNGEYNYWDDAAGPNGPNGDKIVGTPIDYSPFSIQPVTVTTCETALAVLLDSLTATSNATGDGVTVAWTTISELDTLGFHLYRRAEGQAETRLNDAMIPATGGAQGMSYTRDDDTVVTGTTYTYRLESVATDGSTTTLGEVSVTPSVPTAVTLGTVDARPVQPWAATLALAGLALVGTVALLRRRR